MTDDEPYYNVHCSQCGNPLHRTQREIDNSTYKRFFCNKDEKEVWDRENGGRKEAQQNVPYRVRANRGIALVWKGKVYQ